MSKDLDVSAGVELPRCRIQDPVKPRKYYFGIQVTPTTVLTDTGKCVQNFEKGAIRLKP